MSSQGLELHSLTARNTTFKAVRCYRKFNKNRQPTGQQDRKNSENIRSSNREMDSSLLEFWKEAGSYVHFLLLKTCGIETDDRNSEAGSSDSTAIRGRSHGSGFPRGANPP